ncbi:hypothetical protein FB562_0634 [Homoserinimonas aerilata]|uniref:Uncharacterized protein n=1 Tax=Homoserinimonas aerilata TaxID=1162970 RepID=A0A542YHJ0_9MICO|nr:hypothetical protein FB562_0634 [Homoserinimonas aerilata]
MAAVAMAIGSVLGGTASPANAGPCNYEYQGRCYTWLTSLYTCQDIFQTNAPQYRKQACTIYLNVGIMYFES